MTAPYIGSMSSFEAKHPRAKDGKFTKKPRKEVELTLSDPLEEKIDFLSPTPLAGCGFLGEHPLIDDEFQDSKTMIKEYRNSIGYHSDYYDSRGVLFSRVISESLGEDGKPMRSLTVPSGVSFSDNGQVRGVRYSPTNRQIEEHFCNNAEPLVVVKGYRDDGAVEKDLFYTKGSDGMIYGTEIRRYFGGMPYEIRRFNLGKTIKELERFNEYGVSQCRYWNDDRALDLFPALGAVDENFSVTREE